MKKVRLISAILLAIPLIVFGGNYFLELFSLPPGDDSMGSELLQLMRDGGLMAYVAFSHVVFGILLIIPSTRTFGALMQLPISIGMVCFHIAMLPAGVGMAAVMLILNILAAFDQKRIMALIK